MVKEGVIFFSNSQEYSSLCHSNLVGELSRVGISASHNPAASSGKGGRQRLLGEGARWGRKSKNRIFWLVGDGWVGEEFLLVFCSRVMDHQKT